MRLAVFTNQFPGRVTTFFARDIRGLIEAGIDIDVFAIYPYEKDLWRYVPELLNEEFLPRHKVHHLLIRDCFSPRNFYLTKRLLPLLREALTIGSCAAEYGAEPVGKSLYVFLKAWTWAHRYGDVYDHVLGYWGNYAGTCAYMFHRLAARPIPFSLFLHAGTDLYRTPVYLRQKLIYADNIITCSEFNRHYISKHYSDIGPKLAEKIQIHHHGLDFSQLKFSENSRASKRIVAVGRLEKEKGYDYLLKAVHHLKMQGINIVLELIGDGGETKALRNLARELRIDDQVVFRGWVTFNEVQTAMANASVLVHPSPDLGDGVPNVIKEAMAIGTPVIGSAIAGIPELLDNGRNGVLVAPRDFQGLATALKELLADVNAQKQFAQRSRSYVENKFDLWRNGEQLAASLLSSSRKIALSRESMTTT